MTRDLRPIMACSRYANVPAHLIDPECSKGTCETCGCEILLSGYAKKILAVVNGVTMCCGCAAKELPNVGGVVMPPVSEVERIAWLDEEHQRRN